MKFPEFPSNDNERVAALNSYHFEDLDDREDFHFLTDLASKLCGSEIALISLVYKGKQYFLSHHGLDVEETPREHSFCAHAINKPNDLFLVKNADQDERFLDNPLVTGHPNVKFYAGYPIVDHEGYALGTLCLIDKQPHDFTKRQEETLKTIANQVCKLFELHKRRQEEKERNHAVNHANETLERILELNNIGEWRLKIDNQELYWSDKVKEIHGVGKDFKPDVNTAINFYHAEDQSMVANAVERCIADALNFDFYARIISTSDQVRWVRATGYNDGSSLVGSFQDLSELKSQELKLKAMLDSSATLMIFLDNTGRVIEVNKATVNMTGIRKSQMLNHFIWESEYWTENFKHRTKLRSKFEKALRGIATSEEVVLWRKDRSPVTIQFNVRPIFDEKGSLVYVFAEGIPIQDILDAKNAFDFVVKNSEYAVAKWSIDLQNNVIDERFAEMLGYSLNELIPLNREKLYNLIHPEDANTNTILFRDLENGLVHTFDREIRMKHKDGTYRWIHKKGASFKWSDDGSPEFVYAILHDITERKKRELYLEYQENILNTLYRRSPIGILLMDKESRKINDANNAALTYFQYDKDTFLNLTLEDLTPEPYRESDRMIFENAIEKSSIIESYEKEFIRADNSIFPASVQGSKVTDINGREFVWLFIHDLTKDKQIERLNLDAFLKLRSIFDASSHVSLITTNVEGRITMMNSGAERLSGYESMEVLGKPITELFYFEEALEPDEDEDLELRQRGYFEALKFLADENLQETSEFIYKSKDGVNYNVLLSASKIYLDQNVTGYLFVATDITAIQRANAEVRSLLMLTEDQNLRLNNFSRIVSHNLKNHSDGIMGILELLRKQSPDLANNKYLNLFETSAKNLVTTIQYLTDENLLKSKLGTLVLEVVDLGSIVSKNLASLHSQIERTKFEIENQVSIGTHVRGVPAYVDSAVLNIVTNALKYRDTEKKSFLKIRTFTEKDFVVVEFEDNGLGIDLETYKNDLFGLYKTFHDNKDSRGIGLFITKNQMEQMGGRIEISSTLKNGSTFKLYFLK